VEKLKICFFFCTIHDEVAEFHKTIKKKIHLGGTLH
jgi:hypothetical protein